MLAMHPDIQEQVADELRTVFDNKESNVDRSELEKLHLLERCINEALRLFPVVTLMARKCGTQFKVHGYDILPGMSVAIGIREIHRKTRYWGPNAHLYNPDNFLPKNVNSRSPFCFIPFSMGPRNCIGNYFAFHLGWFSFLDFLFFA